ncbi:MAG TPA: tetratricopeptide repeat protein, partial [Bradyrhizobium sp.]|nr:tetratricopeptide repeat protein [Bradyrhizobium sp.]
MARTAAAGFWSRVRACAHTARHCRFAPSARAAVLALTALAFSGACQAADPVKGEASFSAANGYARLVLKLDKDVPSEVGTAGSILVIRFAQPVDIPVDRLAEGAPNYVGSARRDPDGTAIRLSLSRRVTINTMTAGERVFVDLLPDGWTGPPPSLPQEVIKELSDRARAAERALRQQRAEAEAKKRPPIRVRTSVQPTFVRFAFETPDGVGVSSELNEQKLKLLFNAMLTFDLADAKEAAPSNIASIVQKVEGEATAVEVTLIGDVDVHSFREDKNYIIDVAFQQAEKPSALSRPAADAARAAPAPVAAAPPVAAPAAVPAASEKPASDPAAQHSGEIIQPTSETLARQASIEIKPEAAPGPSPAPEAPKAVPAPEMPKSEISAKEPPAQEPPAKESPPPAAEAPKSTLAATEPPAEAKAAGSAAKVSVMRINGGLNVMFAFAEPTPAALFRRA